MFSGIVEDLGVLVGTTPRGNGRTLVISTALPLGPGPDAAGPGRRVKAGDSIAVMGACLTVESMQPAPGGGGTFTVAAGRETMERTSLGQRRVGDRLHLERALRLGDRLDGHLVSGHVDGLGRVRSIDQQAESWVLWIEAPAELSRYLAGKGSVCVDGISLTVNEVDGAAGAACAFRVNLIPFTATHTAVAGYRPGQDLNLEVDLLARYLERLLGASGGPDGAGRARLTPERLAELGFGPPARGQGR